MCSPYPSLFILQILLRYLRNSGLERGCKNSKYAPFPRLCACVHTRVHNDRVPLEEGRLSELSGARSPLKRAAQIELEKVGRAIMKSQVVPASEGHGGATEGFRHRKDEVTPVPPKGSVKTGEGRPGSSSQVSPFRCLVSDKQSEGHPHISFQALTTVPSVEQAWQLLSKH